MPLPKGKKNIGKNIKKEMKAGKPKKQAIAISLRVAKIPAKSQSGKMMGMGKVMKEESSEGPLEKMVRGKK